MATPTRPPPEDEPCTTDADCKHPLECIGQKKGMFGIGKKKGTCRLKKENSNKTAVSVEEDIYGERVPGTYKNTLVNSNGYMTITGNGGSRKKKKNRKSKRGKKRKSGKGSRKKRK